MVILTVNLISRGFSGIHPQAISQVFVSLIRNMCSEILLKLLPHPPEANELKLAQNTVSYFIVYKSN